MISHPYAVNNSSHSKLYYVLVFISISLSVSVGFLADYLLLNWGIKIVGVSSLAIYGILYYIFNKWLWKSQVIRSMLLVPNLNGLWKVVGKTSMKGAKEVDIHWEADIKIVQSWSKILIRLTTKQSSSYSTSASIFNITDMGYRLVYHYDNDPKKDEHELKRHKGLCELLFDEKVETAKGYYFSDKDRMTTGTMSLTKIG